MKRLVKQVLTGACFGAGIIFCFWFTLNVYYALSQKILMDDNLVWEQTYQYIVKGDILPGNPDWDEIMAGHMSYQMASTVYYGSMVNAIITGPLFGSLFGISYAIKVYPDKSKMAYESAANARA